MVRTSKLATRLRKPRALREYKDAVAERRLLAEYLKAAIQVLPKAECDLLSEFVQISDRKCQRLRKALDQKSGKHSSAA
jgi:hypothetical protein